MPKIPRNALAAGLASALATCAPHAAHAAETLTFNYDAKGRVTKVQRTGGVNNGVKTEYTHDKANNRKTVKTTGSANTPQP